MYYLLYIKRSFLRNFRKHLSLYFILTCAFLLPLLISIYRDSDAYGTSQSLLFQSKGQTFHIQNVTQDDCQYFQAIDGLSKPLFEDDTIYLKILNEEEWKDPEKLATYSFFLQECVKAADRSTIVIKSYGYYSAQGISTDPAFLSGQTGLLIINIILIVFASLIVQSSYRSHLQHFSADMKILSFCGADKRQVSAIFEIEFFAVYVASSISAILISAVILKTLFWFFLEVTEVPGLSWLIFHIDIKNTAIHFLIYFLSLGAVLCYSLKQFHNHTIPSSIRIDPQKIRKKKIKIARSPSVSLARLWRQRTNKVFRNCLCISIPLISIFLFLFNYLILDITVVTESSEHELVISNYTRTLPGFTVDDISIIEALDDVLRVDANKVIFPDEYVMEISDGMIFPVRLLSLGKLGRSTNTNGKFEVAVSQNCSIRANHLDEKIKLRKLYDAADADLNSEHPTYDLIIADILDVDTVDWAIDIYMSESLFLEITDKVPTRELKIKLKNINNHQLVEAALRNRFPGAEYEITNNQARVDFVQDASYGLYLLMAYIFAILFILVLLILYVKLCDYVNECLDMVKVLYIIGAEKRSVYQSIMLQASIPALISALLPMVISLPISWYVAHSVGAALQINGVILLVYIVVAVLVAAVYICPVHFTLRRNINKW